MKFLCCEFNLQESYSRWVFYFAALHFYSIDGKLSCFLEEIEIHNLSHILKGQTKEWVLPEFISPDERKKLSSLYRFPEKEVMMVADRKTCYPKAMAR